MSITLETLGLKRGEDIIEIASNNPVVCREDEPIVEVVDKVLASKHGRIPVVTSKNKLVGIITKTDILDAFLREESLTQQISNIMTREVITCDPIEDIEYTLQKFKLARRGGFPIVEKEKLVGIIDEREFIKHLRGKETGLKVKDVMANKPLGVMMGTSIYDCLKLMVNAKHRRLPVIDPKNRSTPIGIITMSDVLKYMHLNQYSNQALDEDINSILVKDAHTINEDADLAEAAALIDLEDISGLIVVNKEGEMTGVITERDILEEII